MSEGLYETRICRVHEEAGPRLAYPVVMGRPVPLECPHLDTSNNPKDITNQCSSVLGDGFHAMHRLLAKVPMDHRSKKAYFVAFQEAFYAWNPAKLEKLKAHVRAAGYDG